VDFSDIQERFGVVAPGKCVADEGGSGKGNGKAAEGRGPDILSEEGENVWSAVMETERRGSTR